MAHAVLQGRHVLFAENEAPVAVGALLAVGHFRSDAGVFELQLHAAHVGFLDRGDRPGEGMGPLMREVPVPVRLHPGLVDAELLPVFVAGAHMVGDPVETLSGGMAVLGQRRGDDFPVLVLAVDVDVVGQVDFLGSDIEAGEFDVFRVQGLEQRPGRVDVPVKRFQPVFHLREIQSVAPVGRRRLFVREGLEHDGVRDADDDPALALRRTDASRHFCAGLFQPRHAAVLTEPQVQLILPDFLVGRLPGAEDEGLVVDPVAALEEEEALEEPLFAAVGSLPAHVRSESCRIPAVRLAVPVADEADVAELARRGHRGQRHKDQAEKGQQDRPSQDTIEVRFL